jgi:hypothetical protein
VLNAIATLQSIRFDLIDLTLEQRKALPNMGDSNASFVCKVLELAKQKSDFVPRSIQVKLMQQNLGF